MHKEVVNAYLGALNRCLRSSGLRCRLRQDRASCTASTSTIGAGEVVALLGPNGAGKTTLLRALSGLLPWSRGSVRFGGRDMAGAAPREAARAGPGACRSRAIACSRSFRSTDNLLLAGYDLPRGERAARVEEALDIFPGDRRQAPRSRRRAVSGGQQQMLAVAQGLVRRPRLLMLDEPSAGLSPVLVDRVLAWSRSCARRAPPCCWSSN